MEKFTIKKSPKNESVWGCFNEENGLAWQFEHGKFNDTHKFAVKHGVERPDDMTLDDMCCEMEDWLWDNHHDKVTQCTSSEA
ncbi:MAG: hypothetical protein LBR65_01320 [Culturomica sp.]|nr:hypothetical protein [Culturomica sp.]